MNLTATKSLERIKSEADESEHSLKRTLGPVNLIALGIGAIIGAGLFSLTGIAAAALIQIAPHKIHAPAHCWHVDNSKLF